MRKTPLVVLAASAGLAALPLVLPFGFGPTAPEAEASASPAAPAPAPPDGTLWDYKVLSLTRDLIRVRGDLRRADETYPELETSLDKLGEKGWELVHAAEDLFIFRRPLSPRAGEAR